MRTHKQLVLLSCLLTLLAASLAPSPASATFPGRNGALIAAFSDNNDLTLWAISPGTGRSRAIFHCAAGVGDCPAWLGGVSVSANGRNVAFDSTSYTEPYVSQTQLAIVPTAGGRIRWLAPVRDDDDESPSWFPGSGRLAFGLVTGQQTGQTAYALATVRPDGSGFHRLRACVGQCGSPLVAPDGRSILFSSGAGLWIMNSNGTGVHELVRGAEAASWAPDSKHIAVGVGRRIEIVDASGLHARTIIDGAEPVFSPDGRRLAFVRSSARHEDVLVISTTGKGLERVWRGSPGGGALGLSSLDWQALP